MPASPGCVARLLPSARGVGAAAAALLFCERLEVGAGGLMSARRRVAKLLLWRVITLEIKMTSDM